MSDVTSDEVEAATLWLLRNIDMLEPDPRDVDTEAIRRQVRGALEAAAEVRPEPAGPLVCSQHPWRSFESYACRDEGCAGPGAPYHYARAALVSAVSVIERLAEQGVPEAEGWCEWFDVRGRLPLSDTLPAADVLQPTPPGWDPISGNF